MYLSLILLKIHKHLYLMLKQQVQVNILTEFEHFDACGLDVDLLTNFVMRPVKRHSQR